MKRATTLLLLAILATATPAAPDAKEDPAATALLAEARAARASWDNFPGFTADLEINTDGKVFKTKLTVAAGGKVTLDGVTDDKLAWAQRSLASMVGHRLPGSAARTPCAFVDDVADHPLGRAVRPLEDEFHSSYRVKGPVIAVVNRHQGDVRFTITSLETMLNAEKKVLPVSYVVDTWDAKSGALKSSEAHRQGWVRVGAFDLPTGVLTVLSKADGQETRRLTITNHALSK